MIKTVLLYKINKEEKQFKVSMAYLRFILRNSLRLFLRLALIMPFANSRRKLPRRAWAIVKLVSLREANCTPCLNIGQEEARTLGISEIEVKNILKSNIESLSNDEKLCFDFAVSAHSESEDLGILREKVVEIFGNEGLIEISYAVASSKVPALIKKCLGYSQACNIGDS